MASTSTAGKIQSNCCEYCKKEFTSKSNLNAHRKIHLIKEDLKCSFCGYTTNFKYHLFSHIRTHTKERPYKCKWPNCTAAFSLPYSCVKHQKTVHEKDDESLKKFKCAKCPYKSLDKSNFDRHLKTHSDVKEFSCDLCPYSVKHKQNFKKHYNVVHLGLRPFKCQYPNCDSAFSLKCNLMQHQLVHNKGDEILFKFKCSECDYKAAFQSQLNKHLAVHSEVKPFACDLCPYQSKHKRNVKIHFKHVHSKLKPFKCPELNCSYSCKTKARLARHIKVHVYYKEFACSFPPCNFRSRWKSNMKNHEMTHRDEKPFACTLCGHKCNHRGGLSDHIRRRHTGEAPYFCPSCPYSGKSSSELKVHVQRHHVTVG